MGNIKNLDSISVESGTAQDGPETYRGFLVIRAISQEGDVFVGQLDPDEVRGLALNFLESAEAADQDCMVMTMLTRDVGLAPEVAVNFIAQMRNERLKRKEKDEQS